MANLGTGRSRFVRADWNQKDRHTREATRHPVSEVPDGFGGRFGANLRTMLECKLDRSDCPLVVRSFCRNSNQLCFSFCLSRRASMLSQQFGHCYSNATPESSCDGLSRTVRRRTGDAFALALVGLVNLADRPLRMDRTYDVKLNGWCRRGA